MIPWAANSKLSFSYIFIHFHYSHIIEWKWLKINENEQKLMNAMMTVFLSKFFPKMPVEPVILKNKISSFFLYNIRVNRHNFSFVYF